MCMESRRPGLWYASFWNQEQALISNLSESVPFEASSAFDPCMIEENGEPAH